MSESLFVVVPCFNEAGSIGSTVEIIRAHLPELPIPARILMIDDGSTDGTRAEMEALAGRYEECEVQVNPTNLGMGRSVIAAYERIPPGSWVTVQPGDNEFAFESIDNFLAVRDRYDIVLGYLQNPVVRTFGRRLASWSFTRVVSTIYGFHWRYLNGMKLYRVEAFKGLDIVSSGHAFMAEMIAKAQLRNPRLRIGEVTFASMGRGAGRSKAIRPGAIVRAVLEVFRGARSVSRYRSEVVRQFQR